jgi:membrane protease YdiL (CAAX protease family)
LNEKGEGIRGTERRDVRLALAALFGGTLALALISWVLPAIAGWLQALLALLLMTIPTWALKGTGVAIDDLGVDLGPAGRTLGAAALVMLVLTPIYVAGFHLIHAEFRGRPVDWSWENLSRWDDDVRQTPTSPCRPPADAVLAWTSNDGLWIVPPTGSILTVKTDSAPASRPKVARCNDGGALHAQRSLGASGDTAWTLPAGQGLRFSLDGATGFMGDVQIDGAAARLEVGAFRQVREDSGRLELTRSFWWVITFMLIHLGLVALPEEWFFRGYLLARLDGRFGTPWRLLGVSIGPGLLLSSLAFALLHPILIPGMHRLMVFFPALLFGWLRARTGNIGAAVVVHAACNLLQAVTVSMYG